MGDFYLMRFFLRLILVGLILPIFDHLRMIRAQLTHNVVFYDFLKLGFRRNRCPYFENI